MFNQSRTICCIIYSINDVQKFIDKFGFADYEYAYIFHDKDKKDDGTPKPPHYHFYGHRKSPITEQSLKNFAKKCEQNIFWENLKSNDGALLRYFTHAENDDKAKYDIDAIVANFDIETRLKKQTSGVAIDPATIIAMYDQGYRTIDIVRKFPKLIYSIASLQRFEQLFRNEQVRLEREKIKKQAAAYSTEQIKMFPAMSEITPFDIDLPF